MSYNRSTFGFVNRHTAMRDAQRNARREDWLKSVVAIRRNTFFTRLRSGKRLCTRGGQNNMTVIVETGLFACYGARTSVSRAHRLSIWVRASISSVFSSCLERSGSSLITGSRSLTLMNFDSMFVFLSPRHHCDELRGESQ